MVAATDEDNSCSTSTSTLAPPMKKRIILFCDGTGRDGQKLAENRDTNVWRLYRVIEHAVPKAGDIEQALIWQPGLGMEDDDTFIDKLTGAKMKRNVRRAYDRVLAVYEPGDEIVFIGFSRGAFICRIVSEIIGDIGLEKDLGDLDAVFEAYGALPTWFDPKKPASKVSAKVQAARDLLQVRRSRKTRDVRISALALFDTVGAIGFISHSHLPQSRYLGFPVEEVGAHVDHIFHALALDDFRRPFQFTRVEITARGASEGQQLHQCFFGGWHADVGGGWDDHELASIALLWMASHLHENELVCLDQLSLLEIPGTYVDKKKDPRHADHPLAFIRLKPPTKPYGDGTWWPELVAPFVNHMPLKMFRPPLRANDTVHASAFSPAQVAIRKVMQPKLQASLNQMQCPELLPLEKLGQKQWPSSPTPSLLSHIA